MRTFSSTKLAKRCLSIPLLLVPFLLAGAPPAAADQGSDDGCKFVHGKFEGVAVPPTECQSPVGLCSVGELQGNFKSSYSFSVETLQPTGDPRVPTVQFFTGTSTLTLPNGDVLVGVDTGTMNAAPPGVLGSGTVSTLLTITEGGAGWMQLRGQFNFATGVVTGDYQGLICSDDE